MEIKLSRQLQTRYPDL